MYVFVKFFLLLATGSVVFTYDPSREDTETETRAVSSVPGY